MRETSEILVAVGHLKVDNRTQLQNLERNIREHIDDRINGVRSLVIQMSSFSNTSKKRNHRRSRFLDDRRHERHLKHFPTKRRYKRDPRKEKVVTTSNLVLSDNSAVHGVNNKTVFNAHSEDEHMLMQKRCSTRKYGVSKIISIEEKLGIACSNQGELVKPPVKSNTYLKKRNKNNLTSRTCLIRP